MFRLAFGKRLAAVAFGIAAATSIGFATSTLAAEPAPAPAPLRIAEIDEFSGPFAAAGLWDINNLRFMANIINKQGGIDGHKLEIEELDDALSPQKALVQLNHAIHNGVRYIAEQGGDSVAFALLHGIKEHNSRNPKDPVMFLNFGAINDKFTNQDCNFYSFLFDADVSMKMNILTNWVASHKNVKKVYLFNQNYVFGRQFAKLARQMLAKKRPDIKIVGDTFIPLAQVKDFTPYVTRIKASGAQMVITGNWGTDISLLVKSAAEAGLKIPFITYYGFSVGTISAVGPAAIGRIYAVWPWDGDFLNPKMKEREIEMRKERGYDFGDIRAWDMFHMLKLAAAKAKSINPTKVAFSLEGIHYASPTGDTWMRASDHQIQLPLIVSVAKGGMHPGLDGTDIGVHKVTQFSAKAGELPTTCHMQRPAKE